MFYSAVSPYTSQHAAYVSLVHHICKGVKSTAANIALRATSLSLIADPSTILLNAVSAGSPTQVKLALAAGADPNFNEEGTTPLHAAAFKNTEVVALLLEAGADPNIRFKYVKYGCCHIRVKYGCTPLHIAAGGHIDVMRLLLDRGADPNAQGEEGSTPLHMAAAQGHIDVMCLLLDRRADPNIKDKYGDTPLHIAAAQGHIDVVALLLDRKTANPNLQNRSGNTPLHTAIRKGHIDVAHLLLQKRADLDLKDADGNTPLHLACQGQQCLVKVKQLIDFKRDQILPTLSALISREISPNLSHIRSQNFHRFLNAQNKKGKTPLHIAAKAGNGEVVECLLENGAQIPPNFDGETPLDLAFAYFPKVIPSKKYNRLINLFKKHTSWANEAAVAYAFEKKNFPALLFILEQKPLLSAELRGQILADAQRPGMESIRQLLEGGC